MEEGAKSGVKAVLRVCPICGRPSEHDTRPFCSRRCADIDLARWLSGSYVITGATADSDEDGDDALVRRHREGEPEDRH